MRKKHNILDVKLDKEEKELLESVERGEWESIDSLEKEIKLARQTAANYLKKDARINVRISSSDLDRLKRIAAYEGLPYQTLISSVLHKFASGHLDTARD